MVSNSLFKNAVKNYGFNADTFKFISDSTNQIYMFKKDGKPYILRFSNSSNIRETKS